MAGIMNIVNTLIGWIWGIPILVVLVGGGILLTWINRGIQFRRFGFIMKNTIGQIFDRKMQEEKKKAGVSPMQGAIAALSGTIGTGNIVGVGVAIALGGPGALFWMWICGFVAMAIKYSEVTLSVAYREKISDEEGYRAGPFMYMKNGLHCAPAAYIFVFLMVVTMTIIGGVHASSVATNMASLGVPKIVTCAVIVAFLLAVTFGGIKVLVKITDKLVPIMTGVFFLCALIVVIGHIGSIGTVLIEIFRGAFTGQAPIGGFTGAALGATVRWGLARGVFSNDAGLGCGATMHAQAESIDHPAQQGMWAVFETFFDTIVVCTLTGLMILFSGVWTLGEDGAVLASLAMESSLGSFGRIACVVCLALFALSSLITISQVTKIQSMQMIGNRGFTIFIQALVFVMAILGTMAPIANVFTFADLTNGLIIFLNVPVMVLLGKDLRKYTTEWFFEINK